MSGLILVVVVRVVTLLELDLRGVVVVVLETGLDLETEVVFVDVDDLLDATLDVVVDRVVAVDEVVALKGRGLDEIVDFNVDFILLLAPLFPDPPFDGEVFTAGIAAAVAAESVNVATDFGAGRDEEDMDNDGSK